MDETEKWWRNFYPSERSIGLVIMEINKKKKKRRTPSSPYNVWIVGGYEPPNFRRAVPEVGFSRENEKGGREDYRGEKTVEEFVYNGSKYPEGTAEKYFGEGSVGG